MVTTILTQGPHAPVNDGEPNSWAPLTKAIREFFDDKEPNRPPPPYSKFPLETAANQAFMYRVSRNQISRGVNSENAPQPNSKCFEFIRGIGAFRKEVGQKFEESRLSNEIKLRRHELDWIKKNLTADDAVITTNWDELLWHNNDLPQNTIQIHGRASQPQSLILPTEMSTDEWLFGDNHQLCEQIKNNGEFKKLTKDQQREFAEAFIRGTIFNALENAHKVAIDWLTNAKELIVWGVGLNVYDAELLAVLRAGNVITDTTRKIPLERLVVVNTSRSTLKHISHLTGFAISKLEFRKAKTHPLQWIRTFRDYW